MSLVCIEGDNPWRTRKRNRKQEEKECNPYQFDTLLERDPDDPEKMLSNDPFPSVSHSPVVPFSSQTHGSPQLGRGQARPGPFDMTHR